MVMKRNILLIISFLFAASAVFAQTPDVKWMKIEDAYKGTQSKIKKKVFVDVYTDWCGWCKRMDQTTFQDDIVKKIMNKYYYSVKLDAEDTRDITIGGTTYKNPNPGQRRSSHQFAAALLNGRMSYPSFVILDENFKAITIIPGYIEAREFEKILWYFTSNDYTKYSYEKYGEIYEKEIRPEMLKILK